MRTGRPLLMGAALALAAAGAGTAIPSLRLLSHGSGPVAGAFVGLHILGGLMASVVLGKLLRAGSVPARRVVVTASSGPSSTSAATGARSS